MINEEYASNIRMECLRQIIFYRNRSEEMQPVRQIILEASWMAEFVLANKLTVE